MSVTVSTKRNRIYVHKFDHDLAKVMRLEGGLSWTEIARELGVTINAVKRVVDPEFRARFDASVTAWAKSGVCVDCGAQISRNSTRHIERCQDCAAIRLSIRNTTSARTRTLRCSRCKAWKPDDAFPNGDVIGRRLRHEECTACSTERRRLARRAGRP